MSPKLILERGASKIGMRSDEANTNARVGDAVADQRVEVFQTALALLRMDRCPRAGAVGTLPTIRATGLRCTRGRVGLRAGHGSAPGISIRLRAGPYPAGLARDIGGRRCAQYPYSQCSGTLPARG